jgi:hypothetical protein
MTQVLLRASPLSAVLVRPADGHTERATEVALGLLRRPRGSDLLASVLSAWWPDADLLHWRSQLLSRVAASHPAFVAEVYAAARLRWTSEWNQRLSWAGRKIDSTPVAQPPDDLAVATIRYWSALETRQVRERLRCSPVLAGYDDILALVRRHGLTAASAP